jgi:hypothetical protein
VSVSRQSIVADVSGENQRLAIVDSHSLQRPFSSNAEPTLEWSSDVFACSTQERYLQSNPRQLQAA